MGLANKKVGGIRKSSPAYLRKMPFFRGASLTLNDNVAGASWAKRKKIKRNCKNKREGKNEKSNAKAGLPPTEDAEVKLNL